MPAEIKNVKDLLSMDLRVPGHQRPYRWSTKNVSDLLGDIDQAMTESVTYPGFKYRIGSVILHKKCLPTF